MIPPLDPSALPEPGFHLIDDVEGRFVVDQQWGIISLANDDVLAREAGNVHGVRLRVIESSGASYELSMQLRITGRVPQMLGAEEFGPLAALTDTLMPDLHGALGGQALAPKPRTPNIAWNTFSAALASAGKAPLPQARRTFIAADLPPVLPTNATLSFADAAPSVMPANVAWSL